MGVLRRCRRVAAWLVVGACLGTLAVAVVVPRLAGATPYTVLTGSMSPSLPPGTLVVSRPVDPGLIRTGTVLTYQLESDRPAVVTHRVVGVRTTLTGRVEWQTQGDANPIPDAKWVRAEQVRGEVWYAVPWLGRAQVWLNPDRKALLAKSLAILLLGYAAAMFAASVRRLPGEPVPRESGPISHQSVGGLS